MIYSTVDKSIFTNCKLQWFLMNGKKKLVWTKMQIESVKQIVFRTSSWCNHLTQKIPNGSSYVIDSNDILGLPLNPSKSIKLSKNADDGIVSEWKTLVGLER